MHLESPGLTPGEWGGRKKPCFHSLSATSDSRAKFEPSSLSSPCQVYHDKQEGGGDE